MVIKRFNQRLQQAFDLWKRGKNKKNIVVQEMTMMEMEEEGAQMAAEADNLDK
jgi:hypothetical protein